MSNNNQKIKFEEKIIQVVEECLENPTLDWAISNIPVYGPLIKTVFTSLEPRILNGRVKELFYSLREEVLLIDQTKIDSTYFESEEFYDLVRKVFDSTVRTRDNNKIKLYSRILVRTPLLDNSIFRHSAEDFISILLDLSQADLILAREVYKQQKDTRIEIIDSEQNELKIVKESGWDNLPSICKLDKPEFYLAVRKLVRTGLIQQVVGTYLSYIGDAYKITPLFRKLMRLIENLD